MSLKAYSAVLCGLGAVLLSLTVFGVWSAFDARQATRRTVDVVRISDLYQEARFLVSQEELFERQYRLEHGPVAVRNYQHTAALLEGSLRQIKAAGVPTDRRVAVRLLAFHTRSLNATLRMFAAISAGKTSRAIEITARAVDSQHRAIAAQLAGAAALHRGAALKSIDKLRTPQNSVVVATSVSFALRMGILIFFGIVLVRVMRRLRRHAEENEHNALHDQLTGLPNRRLFTSRLQHAIQASTRDPSPLSVMMIDLDGFKEINDTLGHATGDLLLKQIGPRIAEALRPGDTIARFGGDEFAVLLPGCDRGKVGAVADRAIVALSASFKLPELTVSVDASIGLVTYPTHGTDPETLIQRADIAMYLAKEQGRDNAVYDPADDPYNPGRLALVSDLRRAFADDELELHYQPKFDAASGEPTGVEALVRWRHPQRGLLMPAEFVPLAERSGLIRPLTRVVLRKAARQSCAWRTEGLEGVRIAVNLSVGNLLDLELVDEIDAIFEQEGLDASGIMLEVTESMVMSDPGRALTILNQLTARGIQISIDDFGTGHASLSHLSKLPVTEIKIDKSFVIHLAVNEQDSAIVRSTIELGHSLGLRVVAEGVEDARSLEMLRSYGCDEVQGFHLGRPLPAPETFSLIRRAQRATAA